MVRSIVLVLRNVHLRLPQKGKEEMASESTADPETGSSVPLEGVDKPHWHEVSNTLQIYLLVFTIIFVVIIGEFLERTRCILSAWRDHGCAMLSENSRPVPSCESMGLEVFDVLSFTHK